MLDIDDNDSVHHPYEGCKVANVPKAMNDHDDSTDSDNNIHDDNTDYHDIFLGSFSTMIFSPRIVRYHGLMLG